MGLLRHHDEPGGERFQMREKLISIGEDFWIENDQGDRAYKVDGKAFRMLCIIDEFSRESLAIRVARKLKATDVIEALCDTAVQRDMSAGCTKLIYRITAMGFGPRKEIQAVTQTIYRN